MLMSVRMAPPLPLIFLLMIHGVSSDAWGVSYSPSHICALKDSTVIMRCTYKYPTGHQIKKVLWTKKHVMGKEPPDLSKDTEYSQRLQYLGDKQQNCNIRLSHVTLNDSHMYYFRFITDNPDGKWTGKPGVTLTVTDLQVESPERVTEGDSVSLTCKSSCTLTDRATHIWYRNSQPLTERRDRNNELLLQSVRREDSGRYSCAVDGHTHISPAVLLNVMYPPRSVSVSISPSGVKVEGDSVTLNCISDSNPPAEISWFKGGTIVGSGRIYSISKISSDDSGEYKCKSINDHGKKNSDAVTLNVMYSPRNVSVSISPSGVIVEGDSVTLNCISDSNPPALNFSWFKGGRILQSGETYSITNIKSESSGDYHCSARNKHGSQASAAVNVNIMYPPKSVSVSISPSGVIVEGDSVTLNCISDSNPPAEISWFKGGTIVRSGRIYNISKISSDDSGEYKCKSINKHGVEYSDTVTLNVMYLPRNVSVLISGSGVIVQGDSVTLKCISDSNPPAEISWFKGGTFVGSGRIFSISKISSDDSGEYKCKSINKHGEKYSDAVTLNVVYSPRNVSVSISPSGVIVEGDSVTLSCISESNPPAEISWFKGKLKILQSGKTYSITNIKSSGDFHCSARNKHGSQTSAAVNVNIMYPPRNVTALISASGEIVEGDSVTLNCSFDSNPPALNFSWFKGGTNVGSGKIYNISKISSDDSGKYKCKSINEHGEKYSDNVNFNVMYSPRNVSVFISPSGVIVEGDSVTLNCISDANPPALNFSWFKGGTIVGSRRIYNISKISSDDSGEYKCKSNNKHGEKYSDAVTLNVMYPPRNVSVLMSGSGVIVEGDSVTLKCISDSNPPALNFSWFKENETSAVGSGQSFSALQSGRFYCQAHNQHGSQRSDAVTVTEHHRSTWHEVFGITVECGALFLLVIIIIVVILFIIKKRRSVKSEDLTEEPQTYYNEDTALELKSMTSDLYNTFKINKKILQ
ncbi:B-cell receptor CD22-like [Siphateles boraxobius]|uniref:B-cell receptor CD22-like n=1 Tax=Siphateles boraxobius TaxID=180520 RepID=UPI004064B3A6